MWEMDVENGPALHIPSSEVFLVWFVVIHNVIYPVNTVGSMLELGQSWFSKWLLSSMVNSEEN